MASGGPGSTPTPTTLHPPPPCVTCSPSVVSLRGPGRSPCSFFTARCGVDPLLKARHAAVLTTPFLFLHRRRVVVVKTLRICTALPIAQPPRPTWCGTRAAGPPVAVAAITRRWFARAKSEKNI